MTNDVKLSEFEISEFGRPETPGVYAIWVRNIFSEAGVSHLLYIGSSANISKRLQSSEHPYRVAFDRLKAIVYVSFYETDDRLNLERRLIEKHQPLLNKQWR